VIELSKYVLEVLRKDKEFNLYRGRSEDNPSQILVLSPVVAYPAPESLKRLEHEYSLREELDPAWAARPMAVARHWDRTVLVLEDPGGVPVDQLLGRPSDLAFSLQVAIGLVIAIDHLHQHGFIHKDIKPANVLANSVTGQCWLTGFGIASRLPRERQGPEPPELIGGTPAYMAPEQTGRMNRSIDSRSDLYALGVTFYEMLTGSLPFTASDPMEWVHCHIARVPVAPNRRRGEIPEQLSAIILKLLAKAPEERYQTAAGVEADLQRCLSTLEKYGRIGSFPVGARDVPKRVMIPEKLYGREREVEMLLAAFDRVVGQSGTEMVLVSGYSGIGKSSVVNELHKALVPQRGLFATGKFDQYKRDIPYATLAQAFQTLIRQILGRNESEIGHWRNALREALGPNGQLIVNLIPEIELIIGAQQPVADLPSQEAQARFQLLFRRFLGVFASPEHPLALFLDDLQWLDAATLKLLEYLVTEPEVRHVIFIGAYRDNEVDLAHPLTRTLEGLHASGAKIQNIILQPLTENDVVCLVSESLRCEPERVSSLAALVFEKTGGNPFFTIQFIMELEEEGLLAFEPSAATWRWGVDRIRAKGYTDNVVDLMVGKLNRFPEATQESLKQLACLGNSAEFELLQMVYADSKEEMHNQLWEAARAGLIFRSENSYRFLHDRVQEAAYSLIPEELRARTHLHIGRILAENTPHERLDETVFDIVNQLNRGSVLITAFSERERAAGLNLIAGKRAKASTAYTSALKYLYTGRSLLSAETWERHYDLIFSIESLLAECELLTGEMVAAESRLTMLALRARSRHDFAVATRLQLTLYTTLDRSDRAIKVFLDYLRRNGTDWSQHPTRDDVMREYNQIWSLVGDRQIEELVELPLLDDPDVLDMLDVFTEIVHPAMFFDENLSTLVVCRMACLCLEHGNCDASCFGYVWFGMFAGPRFNNYKDGFRFGQLGYDLVERRNLRRYQARTYISFGTLTPWAKHAAAGRDLVRRAFDVAYRTGDLTFSAYSWHELITNYLFVGDPLPEVQSEAEKGLAFVKKAGFGLVAENCGAQLGLIRTLRGLTSTFGCFDARDYNESETELRLASNPTLALAEFFYWTRKLQGRFFAGDYATAVDASQKAHRLLWPAASQVETGDFRFYAALARSAAWNSASSEDRQRHFTALIDHHRQLEIWAQHCPANFENRTALVSAEIARIEGRTLDAEQLYEAAIRSAQANGFVHNEAVSNELAARFYAARAFDTIAQAYLRKARYCYLRWGANGKVRQLDGLYPQLREEERAAGPTSTIGASVEHLDLTTVIKVSQAVSGEIVLEKLIDTLMRTAIEHAGAERGLLILPRGVEQRIEAEAITSGDSIIVRLPEAFMADAPLPQSIVHYVVRTRESVILDDASARNPFSTDSYIPQHRARSILCLPLINQAKLIGVLYLENNLASHVFTPTRIAVLKLIASQAAISLENTRLYRDLEEREARIRRLVDANIMGIFIWNLQGEILQTNEAFLHLLEYSREDLLSGRVHWRDLTPEEWREQDERVVAELKATGTAQPFQKEYFRKDGRRVPVLLGAAMFEGNGNEGVAFVVDLSEQKSAEEALRVSEERWSKLAENSSAGIALIASDGTFIAANQALQKMLGYTEAELQGRIVSEITDEEVFAVPEAHVQEGYEGQRRVYRAEKRYLRKDGRIMWADVSLVFVPASGSNSAFFSAVIVDVTERKRAEEALLKAQVELAHATRVMTMGEIASSIAHEINQPLGAIVNYGNACLRLLKSGRANLTEMAGALSAIVNDAERASAIIARIRALSKKTPPEMALLQVGDLVTDILPLVRHQLTGRRIVLKTALPGELSPILGDRIQLQQVLLNLVVNGIEAMSKVPEDQRQLVIEAQSHISEDKAFVLITVTDSGIGLKAEDLPRVFETFYTTKAAGMGMGLAISRSIVEAHGGRLWATPNGDLGATFRLMLPVQT
jgi:PAS domain S-box-containing protein